MALKKEEDVTKPPLGRAPKFGGLVESIRQFGRRPTTLYITVLHLDFTLPPLQSPGLLSPPSLLDVHSMVSSDAASCPRYGQCNGDNAGGQTEVKIKHDFTAVVNSPGSGENSIQRTACFSTAGRRVQTCCTDLPTRLPIKEIPGQLVLSLQPAMDTATPLMNTT